MLDPDPFRMWKIMDFNLDVMLFNFDKDPKILDADPYIMTEKF